MKKVTWNWLLRIVVSVLTPLIGLLTRSIKEELEGFLIPWYEKCLETENPFDDFLAEFILEILGIKTPKIKD